MLGNDFKYENNLFYKIDKRTKKWNCCNYLTPKDNGYISVWVNDRKFYLNRLVYFFHNPKWNIYDVSSENQIDHENENKLDNSIKNLRITNSSQNGQNKTHIKGRLIKGVCFHNDGRKKPWMARWCENKKQKSKTFKTEIEAIECRKEMVEIHHSHHPSKRNKLHNNIENLRITNRSENCQNKTNYGGKQIKGVYFNNDGRKKPWVAGWHVDKKQKTKYFKTEEEAIECRAKMVELHYTHHPSKRERKE